MYHILTSLQRIFNTRFKKCRLLFSAVISEQFSKNRVIISVVAAKIWYLKKYAVFIGPPCIYMSFPRCSQILHEQKILPKLYAGMPSFTSQFCQRIWRLCHPLTAYSDPLRLRN